MARYKVELDREGCIGAAVCAAVAPKFWEMNPDGKVDLIGSKYDEMTKKWELIVEAPEDVKLNIEAEKVCPVYVIKVTKLSD